jgi:hypothetical protein
LASDSRHAFEAFFSTPFFCLLQLTSAFFSGHREVNLELLQTLQKLIQDLVGKSTFMSRVRRLANATA